MNSNHICIERLENGYTVEMDDPAIIKANEKNRDKPAPWRNPTCKFAFEDEKSVLTFLTKNLKKIMPPGKDEYSSSFDLAAQEDDED